jgi:hypothetical protein
MFVTVWRRHRSIENTHEARSKDGGGGAPNGAVESRASCRCRLLVLAPSKKEQDFDSRSVWRAELLIGFGAAVSQHHKPPRNNLR